MSHNRRDSNARQPIYTTDFSDPTSEGPDIDTLESILNEFSRTTANFGMESHSSCDDIKRVQSKSEPDTRYGSGLDAHHNE
jgi:hypothetical protein